MNKKLLQVYIYAIVAMLFWSLAFIWVKQVYGFYKPITVVILRLVLASIFLNIASKLFFPAQKIRKEDYWRFLLLAFFEPFCYFMGESFGMMYVTATLASVIVALIPLVTPLFAWFFIKEKVTPYEIAGLIVSFFGVLMLVMQDFQLSGKFIGYILMFVAVIGGTNYGIALRTLTDKYNSITIVKTQTLIGAFLFLPFFLRFEYSHFISVPFHLQPVLLLILLAIFPSSIAFILLTITVKNIGVVRANIFTNLIPVFTALLSFFILRERFSLFKVSAILVVIFGLFVSQMHRINFKRFKNEKFKSIT